MAVFPEIRDLSAAARQPYAEKLRELFPSGSPIQVLGLDGESFREARISYGEYGLVDSVDDMCQIHVNWCNGSGLAVLAGADDFRSPTYPVDSKRKFPGAKRVKIDGEWFLVTIPDYNDFVEFYNARIARMSERHDDGTIARFLFYRDTPEDSLPDFSVPGILTTTAVCGVSVQPNEISGWQPMLVPLSRTGEISDWLSQYRNGFRIGLGSLMVGNKVVSNDTDRFHAMASYPLYQETAGDCPDIRFCDSEAGGKPISWVVWNGRLIADRILLSNIRAKYLLQQGYLFY